MFPTRHDVFTLLVLPWNHLKLDAGVSHPMIPAHAHSIRSHGDMGVYTCRSLLITMNTEDHTRRRAVCDLSPLKALVKNLIWRQQTSLVGQLVHSRVFDADVVKILRVEGQVRGQWAGSSEGFSCC